MLKNTKQIISGRNGLNNARGIVIIGGQRVQYLDFTVEQNGFSAADSFELNLPFFVRDNINGDKVLANGPGFQSILFTQDAVPIQIYAGFPRNISNYGISDLTKIMDGSLDTVKAFFKNAADLGETIAINGRNVVGQMIDYKITEKYPNLTASNIAEKFSAQFGLTPIITPTTTFSGVYYNNNSTTLGRETNVWDLLLYLAKMENFIVRVKNGQLLFGPYATVTGYVNQVPINYTWGYDIEEAELERSPHAARDIVVKVISYNRNTKGRIVETAKSTTLIGTKVKGQTGQRQSYIETYIIPGLTRDQAQRKAEWILAELSRTELIGTMKCAGNVDLDIDRQIALNGLGDQLSQNYYLNKVTHSLNLSEGFRSEVSFSNQFMANGEPEQQYSLSDSDTV